MFTGIVEEMGTVLEVEKDRPMKQWDGDAVVGCVVRIGCSLSLVDCVVGCSIAVNGTCLTVISFDDNSFTVNLAPETTNLKDLSEGDRVNLERAMPAEGRYSGHSVQGHVDETDRLLETWRDEQAVWLRIGASEAVMRQLVPKGFIALDGVSLTLCEVTPEWFTVMLIIHTQQSVILPFKKAGDSINIETDITGKYILAHFQQVLDRVEGIEKSLNARLTALEQLVHAKLS